MVALNIDISGVKTIRYLLSPDMEVVRCFGVEYNAEQLSEAISKELNRKPS
jgi:protein SCO1